MAAADAARSGEPAALEGQAAAPPEPESAPPAPTPATTTYTLTVDADDERALHDHDGREQGRERHLRACAAAAAKIDVPGGTRLILEGGGLQGGILTVSFRDVATGSWQIVDVDNAADLGREIMSPQAAEGAKDAGTPARDVNAIFERIHEVGAAGRSMKRLVVLAVLLGLAVVAVELLAGGEPAPAKHQEGAGEGRRAMCYIKPSSDVALPGTWGRGCVQGLARNIIGDGATAGKAIDVCAGSDYDASTQAAIGIINAESGADRRLPGAALPLHSRGLPQPRVDPNLGAPRRSLAAPDSSRLPP